MESKYNSGAPGGSSEEEVLMLILKPIAYQLIDKVFGLLLLHGLMNRSEIQYLTIFRSFRG